MQHAHVIPASASRPARGGAAPFLVSLWLAGIAIAWWFVIRRQMSELGVEDAMAQAGTPVAGATIAWLAVTSVFGRFLASGLEALFYWAWWRSLGCAFRWGRFFVLIASLSLIDAWSDSLQSLVRAHAPHLAPWAAPVLGLSLLHPLGATGIPPLLSAFGSLGVLALVRLVLTARAQSREIGRPLAIPLLVTGAAWLLTRLALWWGVDLARGMSPLP